MFTVVIGIITWILAVISVNLFTKNIVTPTNEFNKLMKKSRILRFRFEV